MSAHHIPQHNFTLPLLLLLYLITLFTSHTHAQNTTTSTDPTATTQTSVTQIVQIFFIAERAFEGLPYTLFHRDSGSVIGVDSALDRTTYVITTTRVDQRPGPSQSQPTPFPSYSYSHSHLHNHTHGGDTPPSPSDSRWHDYISSANATGHASTITQGPSTFLFTGTRSFGPGGGPNRTVINECSLNGTVSATCNLTHVGSGWYTADTAWDGTFSTYRYNWTSGDRGGFAPVTITAGGELLVRQTAVPTAGGSGSGRIWV
ncbi:hypothetical protein B0T19DRAFT_440686 [Cercophora scortea]|uniref:Uncharacterized protein n=1 Tax=Cercophora scortea TaxID=314031 RepID=A0AAE0IZC1_9PEZI|nr:hypothetical protein B0T19DRAFT_440686 [Cercophora scortea]